MILLVDDIPENLISLKKVLEKLNFKVDTASSGEEALKKIIKDRYILIILDVQMPGMDGFEVAEIISGFSKAKDTAIIFLSAANTEINFITKGYSSGAIDYITKPVDINILLLKIQTIYKLYEQNGKLREIQSDLLEEIQLRKQTERKKDEFISTASHELKTPLTSVKGYMQLLDRSIDKGNFDIVKNHIQKAQVQLGRLDTLLADLLDISKIESGKLKFNKRHFDLNLLIDNMMKEMKQSNSVFILTKRGSINECVFADEMRIGQVLMSFLANAVKYAPASSEINISIHQEKSNVIVTVQDFGIGIEIEHQKHLFDKFFRVETLPINFQGLGLGLYIAAEIIQGHNGTVGVSSALGEGSQFSFTIPLNLQG